MKNRILYSTVLIGALLAAGALFALAAEIAGEIAGMVTDAGGAPVKGARVAVLDKVAVTGADGRYVLEGLPQSHEIGFRLYRPAPPPGKTYLFRDFKEKTPFLLAAAVGPEGGELAGAAHFRVVSLEAGRLEVNFSLQPLPDDIGAFCRECHPADEFVRSPLAPDPKMSAPGIDEAFYRTHRFRDLHPVDMDMKALMKDKKKKALLQPKIELPLLQGKKVTCDTCHTRHLPTPHGEYMVEEFREGNRLCDKCHA